MPSLRRRGNKSRRRCNTGRRLSARDGRALVRRSVGRRVMRRRQSVRRREGGGYTFHALIPTLTNHLFSLSETDKSLTVYTNGNPSHIRGVIRLDSLHIQNNILTIRDNKQFKKFTLTFENDSESRKCYNKLSQHLSSVKEISTDEIPLANVTINYKEKTGYTYETQSNSSLKTIAQALLVEVIKTIEIWRDTIPHNVTELNSGFGGRVYKVICTRADNKPVEYVIKYVNNSSKCIPNEKGAIETLEDNSHLLLPLAHHFSEQTGLVMVFESAMGSLDSISASDYIQFINIIIGLATGLAHIHDKGYNHNDLALRNCFLLENGKSALGDFGEMKENGYNIMPNDRYFHTDIGRTYLIINQYFVNHHGYDPKQGNAIALANKFREQAPSGMRDFPQDITDDKIVLYQELIQNYTRKMSEVSIFADEIIEQFAKKSSIKICDDMKQYINKMKGYPLNRPTMEEVKTYFSKCV